MDKPPPSINSGRRHFIQISVFAMAAAPFSVALAREIASLSKTSAGNKLDKNQRNLLADLVDAIIPPSGTPGAREAGVVDFIDLMLSKWVSESECQLFLEGLERFAVEAQKHHSRPFGDLSASEQLSYLYALQAQAAQSQAADAPDNAPIPFIKLIKGFTIYGYYTSEIGGSQELELNVMSGYYEICSPRDENTRAVALDNGHSTSFRVFAQ